MIIRMFNKLCRVLSGIDSEEAMPGPDTPEAAATVTDDGPKPFRLEVGKTYRSRMRYNTVRITGRCQPAYAGDRCLFEGREVREDGSLRIVSRTYAEDGKFDPNQPDGILDLVSEATDEPAELLSDGEPGEPVESRPELTLTVGHAYMDRRGRILVCTAISNTPGLAYPVSMRRVSGEGGLANPVSAGIDAPYTSGGKYWQHNNSVRDLMREVPVTGEMLVTAGLVREPNVAGQAGRTSASAASVTSRITAYTPNMGSTGFPSIPMGDDSPAIRNPTAIKPVEIDL